MGATFRVLF
uniref:Uncharacterized protein n=1 Tax=Rhizophora mucronata TaxID=61149 RepID=A0A2P2M2Y7_RHIMU